MSYHTLVLMMEQTVLIYTHCCIGGFKKFADKIFITFKDLFISNIYKIISNSTE